jgi:dephospho-CoA kinase
MKVIGIGGPSGAGKTLLCEYFEKTGFHVIDVDRVAHDLYQDPSIVDQVAALFPTACDLGRVNRAKLGEIVFSDEQALSKLNKLMRPLLQEAVEQEIHPDKHTLIDMAILFDTNVPALCDATIYVTADEMVRKRRIVQRGYTNDTASNMIARQQYMENTKSKADLVVVNDDSFGDTIRVVEEFILEVTG